MVAIISMYLLWKSPGGEKATDAKRSQCLFHVMSPLHLQGYIYMWQVTLIQTAIAETATRKLQLSKLGGAMAQH